mmetsp:Transcript_14485/g.29415  ORF Transcript_14485/g.29415 Transcript_14485/m.29415 type:complete len:811 (-) Transcript_14485:145-2577(-)
MPLTMTKIKPQSILSLLLASSSLSATSIHASAEPLSGSWHRFASNVNYRLSALLDVNGGGFEGVVDGNTASTASPAKTAASSASAGYSMPIDVLTTFNPATKEYRQRVNYFGGLEVDYNFNGEGFKSIGRPFDPSEGSDGSGDGGGDDSSGDMVCMFVGGSNENETQKVPFLNFFPNVEQMEMYAIGDIITGEPGIPYRVASLESTHGSYQPTSQSQKYTMDDNDGMPPDDYFQFHYQDPGTSSSSGYPLKWTMLARNQIFHAHTEHWVLRYVTYEVIDDDDERELWENWFDLQFGKSGCSLEDNGRGDESTDGRGPMTNSKSKHHGHHANLKMNRLGMIFSSSTGNGLNHLSSQSQVRNVNGGNNISSNNNDDNKNKVKDRFQLFLTQTNKHYPHESDEYIRRKSIHDYNLDNINEWNRIHEGKTEFRPNEFLDLEAHEIMKFRGGLVSPFAGRGMKVNDIWEEEETHGGREENNKRNLRGLDDSPKVEVAKDQDDDEDDGSDDDDESYLFDFTTYQLPEDFDPSILPESFDWRTHLPGSVGPIKDQGVCGSCWAFSLVSALESHWFIHNSQSVNIGEQFVIDCAWTDYTQACDGGESGVAAKQLIRSFQGRVPTRDVYGGYLSVDGKCYVDILESIGMMDANSEIDDPVAMAENASAQVSQISSNTVQVQDWVTIPPRDDIATKHALFTQGPLSIAFNVVPEAIYYANGVLDVESCEENDVMHLDHAINLVGWGVDELPDGTKAEHWIIRNSWSTRWGDEGYIKVRMGKRDCGVTTTAGFPVMAAVSRDSRAGLPSFDFKTGEVEAVL